MPFSAFISEAKNDGKEIVITGLHKRSYIKENDFIILRNGASMTRDLINKIRTTCDGSNMFFLDLSFTPRS